MPSIPDIWSRWLRKTDVGGLRVRFGSDREYFWPRIVALTYDIRERLSVETNHDRNQALQGKLKFIKDYFCRFDPDSKEALLPLSGLSKVNLPMADSSEEKDSKFPAHIEIAKKSQHDINALILLDKREGFAHGLVVYEGEFTQELADELKKRMKEVMPSEGEDR